MNKALLAALAVAVVAGGGGFYAGTKHVPAGSRRMGQDGSANIGGFRGRGPGGAGMRGDFTAGEILSKDDKSFTVKMRDGGSKIVFYSTATEVGKFVTGTPADLAVGQNVSVNGKTNTDGSITAQSVQIRPNMPGPSPAPSK